MTFESVQLGAFAMNPGEVTQHHIVMGWTIIIGNPLGILLCWLANGGRKGKNFLMHALPIMIVVGIPFSIGLTLLSQIQSHYPELNRDSYRIGLFYIGNLAMLVAYLYHIRDLAKRHAT